MFHCTRTPSIAVAAPAHAKPPPCRELAPAQFNAPLALTSRCYVIDNFISITAPVVVAGGTTVVFGPGASLNINPGGSLDARGTAQAPVHFSGREHSPGYWNGIEFSTNSSHNRLRHTIVEDAGVNFLHSAAVYVTPGGMLAMEDTTVRDAKTIGLYLDQRATLAAFARNRFDRMETPINLKASDIPMIDAATTYANLRDPHVMIHFGDTMVTDPGTWHALSIPYLFDGSPDITAPITIQSGARLVFNQNTGLTIDGAGALHAAGVSFSGSSNAPGYWNGLRMESKAENLLDNVTITAAGTANDGAVRVGAEDRLTITNSTIARSLGAGIILGERAVINPDAATVNRFIDDTTSVAYDR